MLALMEMTNPMWEWIIAPIALFSLGFFVGHALGRWDRQEDRAANQQRRQLSAPADLRVLGSQDRPPYDWQRETGGF